MGLFLSTTVNRMDKKGRVSVPSGFRAALALEPFQGVILFKSYTQQALEGVGMSTMEGMSNRIDSHFPFFSDDHDELATVLFGESVQLAFDGDGRITLPVDLAEFAGIDDKIAFVGMGQKFQIWNPDIFEARKDAARNAVKSKQITLPKGE